MYRNLSTEALGLSGRQSETIELALSYGFRGIDLDIVEFNTTVERQGLPHARRLIDSAKLRIGGFRLPVDWEGSDEEFKAELPRLNKLLERAAAIGGTRAFTTIQPASDYRPFHENFELHRRRLQELSDLLKPHQIALGVDFQPFPAARAGKAFEFVHTFDALLLLLDLVGIDNIGLYLDAFHLHASGADLAKVRKLGGQRIVYLALADAPADTPLDQLGEDARKLPGEGGAIDAAGLLLMLAEMGYDGPVAVKPGREALAGRNRDAAVKATSEALTTVWKAAGLSPAGKLATASK